MDITMTFEEFHKRMVKFQNDYSYDDSHTTTKDEGFKDACRELQEELFPNQEFDASVDITPKRIEVTATGTQIIIDLSYMMMTEVKDGRFKSHGQSETVTVTLGDKIEVRPNRQK